MPLISFTGESHHRARRSSATPRPTSRACRWSSAASPRASCSPTPTSTPRSTPPCSASSRSTASAAPPAPGSSSSAPIYDEFVRASYAARAKNIVVGDPHDPKTEVGALVHPEHYDKVASLRRDRQVRGPARSPAAAAPTACPTGNYVAPTVFADVAPDARIFQEEIFGPVVAITPFDTDDEALALANDTRYGLAAYIWTNDLTRAHNFSQTVEAGMVWLNSQQRPRPPHPVRRRQGLRPRPRGRLPLDRLLHRPAGRAHHPRRPSTRPHSASQLTCRIRRRSPRPPQTSSIEERAPMTELRPHPARVPRPGHRALRLHGTRGHRPRKSREFYVDVLGLHVTEEDENAIYLRSLEEFIHHNLVLRKGPIAAVAAFAYRVRPPRTSTAPRPTTRSWAAAPSAARTASPRASATPCASRTRWASPTSSSTRSSTSSASPGATTSTPPASSCAWTTSTRSPPTCPRGRGVPARTSASASPRTSRTTTAPPTPRGCAASRPCTTPP